MHLLTIVDQLRAMNGAISLFITTVMTVSHILESGDLNEQQQIALAKRLTDGINQLSQQLWSSDDA